MTAFVNLVAASLASERFTLVDVGCSGGIEAVWRLFAGHFRAIGFDASVQECKRLAAEEKQADVHYIAGFAGIPPDHPFAVRTRDRPPLSRDVYARTSARRMMDLRKQRLKEAPLDDRLRHNAWQMTELADPAKPVIVPEVLRQMGFDNVDLLKVDIDSDDFRVLNSFDDRAFDDLGLLAARLEVNLFGGPDDTTNTFHNTDRFMRSRGFDLVALDERVYSMASLPAPFVISTPAQTETGRVFQADAYYVRDLASSEFSDVAGRMSDEKIAKLAAIYSIWNQPDGAAELLVVFRDRLTNVFAVDAALELLAVQAQSGVEQPLAYRDYIAKFEGDSADFYPKPWTPPPPPPPKTLRRRLAAAFQAYRDPNTPPKV